MKLAEQNLTRNSFPLEKSLQPDAAGHFGPYGGRYVAETLMPALIELERAYSSICSEPAFQAELKQLLKDYAGRPTPLFRAGRLSAHVGGASIYLKREDLAHTGAHKINNTLGQGLLAKWMGKSKVIAETGAGQHGVATATVAALFGMECKIFMGTEDISRQAPNVQRMKLLGAEVVPVDSGTGTLKDAMNEAMRYWVSSVRDTFYIIGSVAGPHPYPVMVRDFQRVIGDEARVQIMEAEGVRRTCWWPVPYWDDRRTLIVKLAEALGNAGRGAEAARAWREAARGASEPEVFELERKEAYWFATPATWMKDAKPGTCLRAKVRIPRPVGQIAGIVLSELRLLVEGIKFHERRESEIPARSWIVSTLTGMPRAASE